MLIFVFVVRMSACCFFPLHHQDPLMQNRITLTSQSGFILLQVDAQNERGKVIRTSYEVTDPNQDVIGRFGSLKEAQNFIKLLGSLDQHDLVS